MLRFEFSQAAAEALLVIRGPDAGRVAGALFGRRPPAGRLTYLSWTRGGPRAAVCWCPPDRLELRVPSQPPWPAELAARLAALGGMPTPAPAPFRSAVEGVIRRVEAWDGAEVDTGAGAQELARDLEALLAMAPGAAAARQVEAARDALDDGLPADAVIASLYGALSAAGEAAERYPSGGRSLPSAGPPGRGSPKRGRSP